ncbi:hypothetical protein [Saccharopolyspora griseoalba]|uniref:Uncharacterized protein n=1 Tax=Saccharopolyspora griseoalba TaxID=1431848 RepID=A0ABW2LHM5_9PSEU
MIHPVHDEITSVPAADAVEQHQLTDPIEIATTAQHVPPPGEADPADVAEQSKVVALDDELRAATAGADETPE